MDAIQIFHQVNVGIVVIFLSIDTSCISAYSAHTNNSLKYVVSFLFGFLEGSCFLFVCMAYANHSSSLGRSS